MKKIFSTLAIALISLAAVAQQPVITLDKTEHDFGKINEGDGRVTTVFSFKNDGMAPLTLTSVRASCGCTTPQYTNEPVEPGQTGTITVTFNPNGRPGRFQKTVTITSNASEATKKVYIKGEVIPKSAKPVDQFKVKMGDLSLKAKAIDFGTIKKGENTMKEIEYTNKTDHEVSVDVLSNDKDNYLHAQATLAAVAPNQVGKIQVAIESENCKQYGPVDAKLYVILNGKEDLSETYRIYVTANIMEDFSKLSVSELQQAPICELSEKIDLGVVPAGKKVKKAISMKNAGMNQLLVRRVYTSDKDIVPVGPKAIKSGKKGDISLTINSVGMKPGQYDRLIHVIVNDPKNPVRTVNAHFTVE